MLREILEVFLDQLKKHEKKEINTGGNKVVQVIEEIDRLEMKLINAIADAERFGDLTDDSHFRTVEVNRIKRIIEAKKRTLETLKQNS